MIQKILQYMVDCEPGNILWYKHVMACFSHNSVALLMKEKRVFNDKAG
jgi:hypothetical protein